MPERPRPPSRTSRSKNLFKPVRRGVGLAILNTRRPPPVTRVVVQTRVEIQKVAVECNGVLREDRKAEPKQRTCLACFENEIRASLQPCGHFVLCKSCTELLWDNGRKCPLCRSVSTSYQAVFLTESDNHSGGT